MFKLMGRRVIAIYKEFGLENTRFLLHNHDRIMSDETVAVSNVVPALVTSRTVAALSVSSHALGASEEQNSHDVLLKAQINSIIIHFSI